MNGFQQNIRVSLTLFTVLFLLANTPLAFLFLPPPFSALFHLHLLFPVIFKPTKMCEWRARALRFCWLLAELNPRLCYLSLALSSRRGGRLDGLR